MSLPCLGNHVPKDILTKHHIVGEGLLVAGADQLVETVCQFASLPVTHLRRLVRIMLDRQLDGLRKPIFHLRTHHELSLSISVISLTHLEEDATIRILQRKLARREVVG